MEISNNCNVGRCYTNMLTEHTISRDLSSVPQLNLLEVKIFFQEESALIDSTFWRRSTSCWSQPFVRMANFYR